jgi:hypothetical protein
MAPSHWTVHPQSPRDPLDARAPVDHRALSGAFSAPPPEGSGTRHAGDLAGRAHDYDALADLFMGGHAASEPAEVRRGAARTTNGTHANEGTQPAASPTIELVVLGHLPVRAAAWASQYCRALADDRGQTVAFVRLAAGVLSIDLFEPGAAAPSQREEADPVAALSRAAREAAHIVIEAGEHGMAAAGDQRIASVTVIAGANEAAMVAAYRSFKALSPADAGPRQEPGVHRPRFQIAVMGAPRVAAEAAIQRIRRASALFLWSEIGLSAVVERVGPTAAASLYRGPGCEGVCALLDAMCIAPAARGAQSDGNGDATAEATPRVGVPIERPALASLVVGLEALPLRCPDEASVEIAWDEAQRVHLLRDDQDGRGLVALTAVAAWVRKHAALIALATGRDPGAIAGEPLMHLFTSEPRAARPLLDAAVRIHLLARAESPWYCAELN